MSHRWHGMAQAQPGAASVYTAEVAVMGLPTRPVSSGSSALQVCFLNGSIQKGERDVPCLLKGLKIANPVQSVGSSGLLVSPLKPDSRNSDLLRDLKI